MKHSILFSLACFFVSSVSNAECNLKVATAAGHYLSALEAAKLRSYQNSSVCEVLNYEFWNCTERQKTKLNAEFDLKQVLGNYCQPHLPPPIKNLTQESLVKAAELYSWQDQSGYLWYALLPGSNRNKTTKELITSKMSPGYMLLELRNLPQNTEIVWNNVVLIEDKSNLEFSLPEEKALRKIVNAAEQAKLKVTVVK